jgi:glycosyltransferase involved in cell wall biosynthesis
MSSTIPFKQGELIVPQKLEATCDVMAGPALPQKKQLSVVHVVLTLDGGGLERVIIDLVREAPFFHQTASILCIEKPGILAPQAEATGAPLYCANKGPSLRWSAVTSLKSILSEIRPDVVHTHQIQALLYLTPISRRRMPVLVHTEHNNQFRRYRTLNEKLTYFSMLAIAGPRADRVFGVSEDATESIGRTHLIPRRKLFTVPNGINLGRFQMKREDHELRRKFCIPQHSFVFGSIGRLTEMKRPDILIRAFERASTELPDSHLLIVGDGPMMPELRKQAAGIQAGDRVHFAGFQPCPEDYLGLLDVFVLTSRMEGMPLAILEAAASGTPVIASRVGGVEEVSDAGRSILLYDFSDMDALVTCMLRVASDASFRQQLGQRGQKHILDAYSSRRMAFDYQTHYDELYRHHAE